MGWLSQFGEVSVNYCNEDGIVGWYAKIELNKDGISIKISSEWRNKLALDALLQLRERVLKSSGRVILDEIGVK